MEKRHNEKNGENGENGENGGKEKEKLTAATLAPKPSLSVL